MVSTLINQRGELYRLTKINEGDYDEYELVNTPVLRYTNAPDCRLALTEDGEIYDCTNFQLAKLGSNYKGICGSIDYEYALSENGDVYMGEIRSGSIRDWRVVDNNVELLSADYSMTISYKNRTLIHDESTYHLEDGEEIIQLNPENVITSHRIIIIDTYKNEFHNIYPEGKPIGCGIVDHNDNLFVILVEEIEGRLKISQGLIGGCMEEIYNEYLSQSHQIKPWIEMIYLFYGDPYLMNANGDIVELDYNGKITESKIPPYIFSNRWNTKSARTAYH